MTTDAATELAILADALTQIVDLPTGGEGRQVLAPPAQVLARAGDITAEALAVAATVRAVCRRFLGRRVLTG